MKTVVVYDSAYGNTAALARAIAAAMPGGATAAALAEADPALPGAELLVVGSPTQGGRPTAAMQEWLNRIPDGRLRGLPVAAFDTRMEAAESGFGLRLLMGVIGYSAPRIARTLVGKGGVLVVPEEGFFVEGKEGPLKRGESERAAEWARSLADRAARIGLVAA